MLRLRSYLQDSSYAYANIALSLTTPLYGDFDLRYLWQIWKINHMASKYQRIKKNTAQD